MHRVLRSGLVKARKKHRSDAGCNFDFAIGDDGGYNVAEFKALGMTDEEIESIKDARSRKFGIQPGEVYYSQTGVYDGELYSFCAPAAIHDICVKYDLYQED